MRPARRSPRCGACGCEWSWMARAKSSASCSHSMSRFAPANKRDRAGGRGGAIRLQTINGKDQGPLGDDGEVLTRTVKITAPGR